ncbi:MAG TPA: hypothetical protein VK968_14975 [Roseimicrobium sp.]|nr:hypothetical protein [Roseimicrobium sp.]
MEAIVIVILLVVVVLVFVLPIVAMVKASNARSSSEETAERIKELEVELIRMQRRIDSMEGRAAAPASPSIPPIASPVREPQIAPQTLPVEKPPIPIIHLPPVLPSLLAIAAKPVAPNISSTAPRMSPVTTSPPQAPKTETATAPAFNWEQFMGVKMFAWLGGLVIFLGVAFAIKYSFEKGLISQEMRRLPDS